MFKKGKGQWAGGLRRRQKVASGEAGEVDGGWKARGQEGRVSGNNFGLLLSADSHPLPLLPNSL